MCAVCSRQRRTGRAAELGPTHGPSSNPDQKALTTGACGFGAGVLMLFKLLHPGRERVFVIAGRRRSFAARVSARQGRLLCSTMQDHGITRVTEDVYGIVDHLFAVGIERN